ncbi:MAG: hypothetical protein LUC50_05110 [Ruminococcus sp.]|nr:hypothetical protein [Ruminococcus sp.]
MQLHDFQESSAIADGIGDSIENALSQSAVAVGKELFLGHVELIAYEDPAFNAKLDAWMEMYRLSPSCRVLGLADGESLEEADTLLIVEQLQYAEENGCMPQTNLYTILKELAGASASAVMPIYSNGAFSAAIIAETQFHENLSADVIAGLCWLRGDAYPSAITLQNGENYFVTSASTQLTA